MLSGKAASRHETMEIIGAKGSRMSDLDQAGADRDRHGLDFVRRIQFLAHPTEMEFDGSGRDPKLGGGIGKRVAKCREAQTGLIFLRDQNAPS